MFIGIGSHGFFQQRQYQFFDQDHGGKYCGNGGMKASWLPYLETNGWLPHLETNAILRWFSNRPIWTDQVSRRCTFGGNHRSQPGNGTN